MKTLRELHRGRARARERAEARDGFARVDDARDRGRRRARVKASRNDDFHFERRRAAAARRRRDERRAELQGF
jgi:hypothetical protein